MALEIERKFLLPEAPAWLGEHPGTEIEQGYLAVDEGVEVRLRRAGERRYLTVKGGHGEVRKEAEAEIDARQFWAFWPLTGSRRLCKVRHLVPLDDLTVEVDVYRGDLDGLVVAEIEFDSEQASSDFEAPEWMGVEITGDSRFANQALAEAGVPPDVKADRPEDSGQGTGMSTRGQRALTRAVDDRKAQVAGGAVAVAGAALAGKIGIEKLREKEVSGPSRAYRLKTKEKPKQGIRRIARGRAADALDQLEDVDAGAVHEARKDLKKLRSLLRLVRDHVGDDFYRTENRRFRDAGRLLSAARDAEVKLETLDSLQERFGDKLAAEGLKDFRRALEDERTLAADALAADTGPVNESVDAIAKGRNRVTGWALQTQGWELVGPGLLRSYRRGRKLMKRTRAEPRAENVHEWRKRCKDLWYQLRILYEAWPETIGPLANQAHGLADLLGEHHDLEVLAQDARRRPQLFADQKAGKALVKLARRRQEELLRGALELGERIYAEKPKAFKRRFEAYWHAWRPA